jgi:Cu-Zn family superoxide dismutase
MDHSFLLAGAGVMLLALTRIMSSTDLPDRKIIAIASINDTTTGIRGTVTFTETDHNDGRVEIAVNITGLPSNSKLGFHIHEAGDMTEGCVSACAHLNPFGTVHGGPDSKTRHVGDLGNIQTDSEGSATTVFVDHMIKLRGYRQNIVGRAVVIHEKTDDLGLGQDEESLRTGNAGKRIACAVIGYSKTMYAR